MLRLRTFRRPLALATAAIIAGLVALLVLTVPAALDLGRRQDRVRSLEARVADWNGRATDAGAATDAVEVETEALAAERTSAEETSAKLKEEMDRLQRRLIRLEKEFKALAG
jgi:predicted  nucleic acid-binding Zn-ribbon protein